MKRRRRKKTGTYELIYVMYVLVVLLFLCHLLGKERHLFIVYCFACVICVPGV